MKKLFNKLVLLLLIVAMLAGLASCTTSDGPDSTGSGGGATAHVDYVSQLKLDMTSTTKKMEVTVKNFIDGDTTHFNASGFTDNTLKARYLAINTPESTGKIEEWGKKASNFTKEKLSSATSIIVESDNATWNADSTGGRYMVWVWYKPQGSNDYRNLNLEILQNGLCIASSSANNRYGETCVAALNQAKAEKLDVHSGKRDPDFYYGDVIVLSLKELRCNIDEYTDKKVSFEGVITRNYNDGVYVEEYDEETGLYFGMYVYYGHALTGDGLKILDVGNRSRIVGTVSVFNGSYQVSGLQYRAFNPDASSLEKLSDGHSPAYAPIDADDFTSGKVDVELGEEIHTLDYAQAILNTSVSMDNLTVKSISTTHTEASNGAMTLTCTTADGKTVKVRTDVLRDENGELITADAYQNKVISVQGIVDYFYDYQIKVLSYTDITIKN